MSSFESGGATLCYQSHGSGRPVVLLHSLAGDSTMWAEIGETLAARARVIALDARGHGGSFANGEISVAQYARDAAELADMLDLSNALVVGLSMGGQAAMMLAEARPRRVAGLVLADTSLGRGEDGSERRRSIEAQLAEIGMEGLTGQYVASRTEDPGSAGALAFAEHMRGMRPEIYLEQSVSIARLDLAEAAGKISVPTLILVGENDVSTPITAANTLAEAIEEARIEIIPDANHLSVLDRPEAFAGHIAAQLDALDAGEGRN